MVGRFRRQIVACSLFSAVMDKDFVTSSAFKQAMSHGEVLKVSKAEGLRQIRIKILPILDEARV